MRETCWSFFFDQSKKRRETGEQFLRFRQAWYLNQSRSDRGAFELLVQVLLEAGYVGVEAQDFGRERVLSGKLFGPPNTLLPPPEHPGKMQASASSATTGARSNNTLGQDRNIPRFIAESTIPRFGKFLAQFRVRCPQSYNKPTVAIPRHHPSLPGGHAREGDGLWLRPLGAIFSCILQAGKK